MKSFFSWPIRRHLLLLVFLGVLPALGIIVYSGVEMRGYELADAKRSLTRLLDSVASGQENLALQTRALFETLSDLPEIRRRDSRACSALLASLLRRNPQFANILAADPDGNVFASGTPAGAINAADRKYFRDVLATRDFSAGEYAVSRSTGKPSIHFAGPVVDGGGTLRAVILAAFDLRRLRTAIAPERTPRNSVFVVTDHAGIVLHDSRDPSLAGHPAPDAGILDSLGGPADEGSYRARSTDGIRRLFAFRRLRVSPGRPPYLFVAVGIPEYDIYAVPDRILARNLVLLGLAALLGVAVASLLGKAVIVDRIRTLVSASQRFGGGDLAARAGLPRGDGEIGVLAGAFDEMAQAIEAREGSQRAAEDALRESEARYRSLFQDSPAVMLLIDPDTGSIADANAAACRYYGFSRDELRARKITDINTLPAGKVFDMMEAARSRDGSRFVFSHRLASGEVRPVEAFSGPVPFHGRVFLHSIVHDISARRSALEALRVSEERYRLVVENASDAIFVAQDGFIKFPNSRATTLMGYTAEELTSRPFPGFIHPDDRDMVVDRHRKRLAGHDVPPRYPFRLLTKPGDLLWIEICSVLISWEGRPATLNFLRDITFQKKLEEQLRHAQKMEAVGTLAGGIAHDFNNLLQAITGFASLALLAAPESDERTRSNIRNIATAAERGAVLVRRLLAFSRQDASSAQRLLDLNIAVGQAAEILERTIPKMIRIETRLASELQPVLADPIQIEQVIMNLATNARDAMPDGGRILIETENCVMPADDARRPAGGISGPCVVLRMTDSGVGMDEGTMARMYDPFFTTKGVGAGTGLGLSTIYGIVLGHGGWIHCESGPGRGTRFEIVLPAADASLADSGEERPTRPVQPGRPGTILLVDDEEMIRGMGKAIFEADGHSVVAAESGEEALDLFRRDPARFDLVVLDIGMPGMGGMKCLQEMRRVDPGAKILVASGYSEADHSAGVLDAGACGFLPKPFTARDVLETVRTIFAARHSGRTK
ncbi:MAG: PAS domain S-box protein [Gemmatimonadota bacterium]